MGLGVAALAFLPHGRERDGAATGETVATTPSGATASPSADDSTSASGASVSSGTTTTTVVPGAAGIPPELLEKSLPAHRRRRGGLRGITQQGPRGLEKVDAALENPDSAVPLALIERELETRPASDEAGRTQVVMRLAKLKNDQRAQNRLIAEATSGLTRGERLAALDALANPITPAAKPALESLASDAERDADVRRRAREILGRK